MSGGNIPSLLMRGGIPNSLIRSALFVAKSLGAEKRKYLVGATIYSQKGYEISYTGEELNQYDCQVLYAVFAMQRGSGVEFGNPVAVSQAGIISLLEKSHGGSSYEPIYQSMRRMTEATIKVKQGKSDGNRVYHGHIIDRFYKDDRGHLCFTLNPDLVFLFEADCTIITLRHKVRLNRLISKWLYDFASSHSSFIPLTIDHLMNLSGYGNSKSEFTRQLGKACDEIMNVLGEGSPFVGYDIKNGKLTLYKYNKTVQIDPTSLAQEITEENNPFE